ncbi:hypothetical protein [Luteipulveratus mongoliensis]|nr:hypothetical protein [Luteipulveratus mongoliensis]
MVEVKPDGGPVVGGSPTDLDQGARSLSTLATDMTTSVAKSAKNACTDAGGASHDGQLGSALHGLSTLVSSYTTAVGTESRMLGTLARSTAADLRNAMGH